MGYPDVRPQHDFEASSNPVLHLPALVDKSYYLISTDIDNPAVCFLGHCKGLLLRFAIQSLIFLLLSLYTILSYLNSSQYILRT